MRRKSRLFLVAAAIALTTGSVVWPGCFSLPLPSSRKPISSLNKENFNFPKTMLPAREEVIAKVGTPDAYFPDLRVACYRINEVTRRSLEMCLIIPLNVEKYEQKEVAFIQFDDSDRVKLSEIREIYEYNTNDLRGAARAWITNRKPKSH
ncbi:MAG TPA: hypothetical protein VGE41_06425 [Verrucomicrobiae bacterium]